MAAPRGMMNIEVTGSPALSVGEPPSVPSRISVVLVEEANSGETPRLECPHEDKDIRLLAGEAKPASVTVCEDDLGSPCVGGTLSSADMAGGLLPVVQTEILFPVGPVDSHCPLGDLRRFPHEFRWCGSRRPKLRALHVWGVQVRIRICGYWLEWRSRLAGPFG